MITTTATDIQNNFGKYLKAVQEGNEIIIDGTDNVEYIPLCGDCYLKDVKKIDYVKVKRLVK